MELLMPNNAALEPPLTIEEQIALLLQRGMNFGDEGRAAKYLEYIGYHRLSFYWGSYYRDKTLRNQFIAGVNFEDILNLYIFDRKMRSLFFEAAERIEVCLKVLFSNVMALRHGSDWYLKANIFSSRKETFYVDCQEQSITVNQQSILKELNETIKKSKKNNPSLNNFSELQRTALPSWELFNLMTFGDFSRVIALVDGKESADFYQRFALPKAIANNWIECIVSVRNICAHYGYFAKRSFSLTPKPLSAAKNRTFSIEFDKNEVLSFYAQYCVFSYFLSLISPTSSWSQRIKALIEEYAENPYISFEALGFPLDWEQTELFQNII